MIAYPINTAIQSKNCPALLDAIASGAALDGRDEDGRTALWLTVERGETEMFDALLEAGASPIAHAHKLNMSVYERLGSKALPDPKGPGSLLHQAAAWRRSGGIVRSLLARGYDKELPDENGATPLMLASYFAGDEPSTEGPLEILLAAGASVHALDRHRKSALDHAGRLWVVERLLAAGADPDGGPWSPEHSGNHPLLTRWAINGNAQVLDTLLRAGAEVRKHPGAVAYAAHFGSLDCIERLLRAGADPNDGADDYADHPPAIAAAAAWARGSVVTCLIRAGATALDHALYCAAGTSPVSLGPDITERLEERLAVIRELVAAGANPNRHRDSQGHRALHVAAGVASVPLVEALLSAGAEIDAAGTNGETALFVAAKNGCADVVACLIRAGADVRHANHEGTTPYAIAKKTTTPHLVNIYPGTGEQLQVMRLLREAGGGPVEKPVPPPVTPAVPAGPKAGDRVRHKKFGEGAVTHVAGSGDEAKLTIAFDSGGERTLVARFLERI